MSFETIAIQTNNLGKCYEIYNKPHDRLLQMLSRGKKQYFREFWALRNISLSIRKGETFGIVGRNGAGKSTLLQLISGVLTPTTGSINTNGRITALLELGAGLNTEFNGIENIHMTAAVLGVSKSDLDKKFEEIIEFANLGDFIYQPVKHYSSGMTMRLAFAVAISFDPDILIIDEALAVGDELFQLKCIRRIQEIKESGATILFVSHSTHTINQICDRAVLIDGGHSILTDQAKLVSERYTKLLFSLDVRQGITSIEKSAKGNQNVMQRIGDHELGSASVELFHKKESLGEHRPMGHIVEVGIAGHDYRNLSFQCEELVRFQMRIHFKADASDVIMGMMIMTPTGIDCYHTNLLCKDQMLKNCGKGQIYLVTFEIPLNLNPGSYIVVFDCQYDMNKTPKLVDIFYEALKFSIHPDRLIGDGGIAALNAKIECKVIQ